VPLRTQVPIDPEAGIPDLIRRLTDDSKRLASDEVRLAKLELGQNIKNGARGTLWLALAFGVGTVTLVALTIGLITAVGRWDHGHMWAGALIVGALELAIAALLVKRGVGAFTEPSYTLTETRQSLKDTQSWAAAERAD
jgi:uncharacterized membrane protein YqjE